MQSLNTFKMNSIDEAIVDLKAGKLVVVMDDKERENEGGLICSAELCTKEMAHNSTTLWK